MAYLDGLTHVMTFITRAGNSFYHAVAHASVVFIQAALSFDRVSHFFVNV